MPPKNCGSCSKLVFPMEEIKCLDKTWHKACFKCQVCNMTLNMKNYKGYDKLPYCNAHYPQTRHTAVADTPEARRLAKNSKIQSNVVYHNEFKQSKGQYTYTGTDNPEMRQHMQNTENASLIKYHADFEKAKGQYTSVADDPETLRVKKNMQTISNVAYHGDMLRKQEMENVRPSEYEPEDAASRPQYQLPPPQQQAPPAQTYQPTQFDHMNYPTPIIPDIPRDYVPPNLGPKSYSRPVVGISKGGTTTFRQEPQMPPPQQQHHRRQPGSISDYDPMSDNGLSPYTNRTQSTTVFASSHQQPSNYQQAERKETESSWQDQQPDLSVEAKHHVDYEPESAVSEPEQEDCSRRVGSISDYDPINDRYGSIAGQYQAPSASIQDPRQAPPPSQQQAPPQHASRDPYAGKGKVSKALYDYVAADDDEVGFNEDDVIIKCEPIDEGWMSGTVERTGASGMLPANYVDRLNW